MHAGRFRKGGSKQLLRLEPASCSSHASHSTLPGSVLVDHRAILPFLWWPDKGWPAQLGRYMDKCKWKEVRIMTQKSGERDQETFNFQYTKNEREPKAIQPSKEGLERTDGTDGVAAAKTQPDSMRNRARARPEAAPKDPVGGLTPRPTARASGRPRRSRPRGGAAWGTRAATSRWAPQCPNGRKEAWWTSSCRRLAWRSFSAERRAEITFPVCWHRGHCFGALVRRRRPSHCLGQ